MNKYLDWRFRGTTWVALVVALVCVAGAFLLPESYGNKNSPIEDVQMTLVLLGLVLTATARDKRPLYVFASLVLFLVFAREVNYGRTLFIFADPDDVHKFPKWKDMEYGWLAHVVVGLYIVYLLFYFIARRVWDDLRKVLCQFRIPVFDGVIALCGMVTGIIQEWVHDCLSEELGELTLYAAGVGILYLYTRNKLEKVTTTGSITEKS